MKRTIFILFCILVLRLYDFIYLEALRSAYPIFLVYFLIYLFGHTERGKLTFSFHNNVLWIAISVVISSILGITYWGQQLIDVLKGCIPALTIICMYFFLKRSRMEEAIIIKCLLIFTIIWGAIEWLQQITYPRVYFQGRENIEIRMGLYRYYITGIHFAIIILLYYISRFATSTVKRRQSLLLWLIALISIIGYVSRKQIYASILCSGIAFFAVRGRTKILIVVGLVAAFGIGISYLGDVMTALNSQTVSELNDDDFIRFVATKYFLYDFSDSPVYYLFGTGPAFGTSGIGAEFQYLQEVQKMYRADCGIVGYFTSYGFIGCLVFILPIIRILHQWKKIELWHKLYLLYFSIMITMAFWGNSSMGLFSFVLFLYSVELNINKNENRICRKQSKGGVFCPYRQTNFTAEQ